MVEESRTKVCSKCKTLLPVIEFHKNCRFEDGFNVICKKCKSNLSKKHRENNKEKLKAKNKEWREANRERVLAKSKEYGQANREKKKEYDKKYREKNREKLLEGYKEYYRNNLSKIIEYRKWKRDSIKKKRQEYRERNYEKFREYNKGYHVQNKEDIHKRHKQYRTDNRDRISIRNRERNKVSRSKIREYMNLKYRTDINFKLIVSSRSRIRAGLNSNTKSSSTRQLLGCSIEILKFFLESQFYPNPETGEPMTWENYGYSGWHIDHVKPCSVFDFSDSEQQRAAFHVSNLQPLWSKDNFSKSNKLDLELISECSRIILKEEK